MIKIENLFDIKNIPTVIEKHFDFADGVANPGEPLGSNAYDGCPIDLESSNNSVQFLGYGYIFANIIEAFPLEYQASKSFTIAADIRTQYSMGIIFYDFVLTNFNYLLIQLIEGNSIQILFKDRLKYNDPSLNNPNEFSTVIMNFNKSFHLGKIFS